MYRVTHYHSYYLTREITLQNLESVLKYLEYYHKTYNSYPPAKIEFWTGEKWERVRVFKDTENGELFNSFILLEEFNALPPDERENIGFYQWLRNCTNKNGFLEEIN
jgi:hypothetical protein